MEAILYDSTHRRFFGRKWIGPSVAIRIPADKPASLTLDYRYVRVPLLFLLLVLPFILLFLLLSFLLLCAVRTSTSTRRRRRRE